MLDKISCKPSLLFFSLTLLLTIFIACGEEEPLRRRTFRNVSSVVAPDTVRVNQSFDIRYLMTISDCLESIHQRSFRVGDTTVFELYDTHIDDPSCNDNLREIPSSINYEFEEPGKKYLRFNDDPLSSSDSDQIIIDSLIVIE
ncbi:MAG: hypothetical protein AAFQ94_16610 [Bacteroidota bacterium]